MEKQVHGKMKKLNALKHTTQTQKQRLEELKFLILKSQNISPLPDIQNGEEEKKLRILENSLEKSQLKYDEAVHMTRVYRKLKEHLQQESLTFEPLLDKMETEVFWQTQVLRGLQVKNNNVLRFKDAAEAELQLQEEQVYRERREREKILSRCKKQAEERIAQAERRPQMVTMNPDELSSEAPRTPTVEVESISTFEASFQLAKEATGVTDSQEIVDRFISMGEIQGRLEKIKAENERILLELKEERNRAQTEYQDVKYSRKTEFSSIRQMLQDCERDLQQEQQRRDAAKDGLERLTHTLNTVKAGVQQLSDKLQPGPLMTGPSPELPLDSSEHMLQLMSEAEQKLMLLKEELQGKDLATIMKELEEEEFYARIAGRLPQYNTRIRVPGTQHFFDGETLPHISMASHFSHIGKKTCFGKS